MKLRPCHPNNGSSHQLVLQLAQLLQALMLVVVLSLHACS